MKIFIDTANVSEIREANDWGVVCGVTTNPSLIAREGRDFKEVVTEITSIVDGPISAEVISLEADGMVSEALELSKIHPNIVIKIPMTSTMTGMTTTRTRASLAFSVKLTFSSEYPLPLWDGLTPLPSRATTAMPP